MASWLVPELSSWKGRGLTIPPDSWRTWLRLAVWEFWMGMLICGAVAFGVQQIASVPNRILTFTDFTGHLYRTGGMNALFTFMCGMLFLVVAAWLLWELWLAARPRAIADDFLKLLHDSFARDWRNPLTWPWARLAWAYGFTLLGASFVLAVGLGVWSVAFASPGAKPLRVEVHTSESFEVRQSP